MKSQWLLVAVVALVVRVHIRAVVCRCFVVALLCDNAEVFVIDRTTTFHRNAQRPKLA